jgi:hypothetical protein
MLIFTRNTPLDVPLMFDDSGQTAYNTTVTALSSFTVAKICKDGAWSDCAGTISQNSSSKQCFVYHATASEVDCDHALFYFKIGGVVCAVRAMSDVKVFALWQTGLTTAGELLLPATTINTSLQVNGTISTTDVVTFSALTISGNIELAGDFAIQGAMSIVGGFQPTSMTFGTGVDFGTISASTVTLGDVSTGTITTGNVSVAGTTQYQGAVTYAAPITCQAGVSIPDRQYSLPDPFTGASVPHHYPGILSNIGGNLLGKVMGVSSPAGDTGNAPVTTIQGVGALVDKTGYKLSSDGLDSIATTPPTGPANTFPKMLVQLWRRFFAKATISGGQLKTYADDGTTVVTTQTVSDATTSETQGVSS